LILTFETSEEFMRSKKYKAYLILQQDSNGQITDMKVFGYLPKETILSALVDLEEGNLQIPDLSENLKNEIEVKKQDIEILKKKLASVLASLVKPEEDLGNTEFEDIESLDLIEKQFIEILDKFFETVSGIREYGEMFCINAIPKHQSDEDLAIHDNGFYYKNNLLAELDTMILEIKRKENFLKFLIGRKKQQREIKTGE
jgi:hypothetical protein